MNVAIIVTSLTGGGAERAAGYLSKALANIYTVYIFLEKATEVTYDYGGKLVEYREAFDGEEGTIENSLVALKRKYDISVSISFTESVNFSNIRSRCNDSVIVSERTVYSQFSPRVGIIEEYIRKYYNDADAVVACAHGVNYVLQKEYGINRDLISVIYNMVDQKTIHEKSCQELEADYQSFIDKSEYYVSVGRLVALKKMDFLIKQFAFFHKDDSHGSKLVIVGDGPLKDRLKELISDLGLDDFVIIIPYSSNPFKFMKYAKALLHTSDYEGMPNVFLEAMSLGLPIISIDCISGPRELIADETDYSKVFSQIKICSRGILVKKEKEGNQLFANAIRWLNEHEEERKVMVENVINYMSKYSNEAILTEWKNLIEKTNKNKKSLDIVRELRPCLTDVSNIYIYGAGKVARRVYSDYSREYRIKAFVCTSTEGLDNEYDGVPIISINDVSTDDNDSFFLVAVSDKYLDEVCNSIKMFGYTRFYVPF